MMIVEESSNDSPMTSTSTSSASLNNQQHQQSNLLQNNSFNTVEEHAPAPASHEKMPAEKVDRDGAIREFQNRLVLLHHASNCPFSNRTEPKPCRGFPSCYEMVQLLKHVNNCELRECGIPHCVSTRYLLTHNRNCVKEDCIICKPLKDSIKRKSERSRQVVTVLKRKREDGYMSIDEISPLSTPRLESDLEEEERRRRRQIEPVSQNANTSGESESDTASQISSTIYQAFASECFAMDQSDDILDTMNECLNIPPHYLQQQQQQILHHQQPPSYPQRPPIVPTLAISSITNNNNVTTSSSSNPNTLTPRSTQPGLSSSTIPYHCYKCSTGIPKGYRYYCELCNVNMCMDCFHCEDSLPHEHPVRAMKVEVPTQIQQLPLPQPPSQPTQNQNMMSQY